MTEISRLPHAVMDVESRFWKGEKIKRILGLHSGEQPLRVLEVGAGSGGIAHYFSSRSNLNAKVVAVDVLDQRQVTEGYEFYLVEGVELPFASGSFDVVISNHVIEHVGNTVAQMRHLEELKRVLSDDGIAYLAVPNRWMLVEPHFRLIFLSWLPRCLRSPYVRWAGKGAYYDCEPLELRELERMLRETGFTWRRQGVHALRAMIDIEENAGAATRVVASLPDPLLKIFEPIIPTIICTLRKK